MLLYEAPSDLVIEKGRKIPFRKKKKRESINKYMDGMMNRKRCIWRFFTIYFLIFGKQTATNVAKIVEKEKRTLAL